jgi:putative pyruvate formate lyase activating enzyme
MDYTADYKSCRLCPRECGVNRLAGERGVCGETATCRIASATPHFGEEPPISGTHGSGTIFFTGCSSRCFFCQNHQISTGNTGFCVSEADLAQKMTQMAQKGVHNINFVTPDHFWPQIEAICRDFRENNAQKTPFLYNGSGYQKPEMIDRYAQQIDIFLPDFKFFDPKLAKICMGDPNYADFALKSLKIMVEAKGFLSPWDDSGQKTAQKGVLVRHLVLPGHAGDSCAILDLLFREFGRGLPLSIMSQYHPVPACREKGLLSGRVSAKEYQKVLKHVENLGFEHVFVQEGHADDTFLPDFDQKNPFPGPSRR